LFSLAHPHGFGVRLIDQVRTGFVRNSKGHVGTWRCSGNALNVLQLVIEEDVWVEFIEDAILGNAPEKEDLVAFDSPAIAGPTASIQS
jgi:hypothetical protein